MVFLVIKRPTGCHAFCCGFLFFFTMMNINIGTIDINGARSAEKRASLFKMCELKKLDVTFVQETHSDSNKGHHKLSTSAGVGHAIIV